MSAPFKRRNDDDEDDEEEEDEFGLMVSHAIHRPHLHDHINRFQDEPGKSEQQIADDNLQKYDQDLSRSNTSDSYAATLEAGDLKDKVWKRMKDPLPEQDARIKVKARKTLKQEIVHNKDLLHKMTNRLFDDRLFIIDESGTGGEELALNTAIGTHKHKNPMVAKMAEYMGPMLEGMKVGLSLWRAGFNLLTWRDPYLTFLFQCGVISVMCVLIVFPWRIFFFVMGIGMVGPQNWLVRLIKKKTTKKEAVSQDTAQKSNHKRGASLGFPLTSFGVIKSPMSKSTTTEDFRFHNHLMTSGGVDLREEKSMKSSGAVYRAVVPTSPLISRRFYDWPPNPSLSKVDVNDA